MTTEQRAALRDLARDKAFAPLINDLVDTLDKADLELAQLRRIARCADTVSDGIAEFGEVIPEQLQALDEALDGWRAAGEGKVWA